MNRLRIAENLANLRKQKKVTQDELANFLGVTKASVSKWENRQSYPDVLLIPQIAGYFDVTIDALMGYEPQLSRAQIRKYYHELSMEFAEKPFEEVMTKTRNLVKEYYSCNEFLVNIAILWMNHFMIPEEPEKRNEVLTEIVALCHRVKDNCREVKSIHQAAATEAVALLQMGKAEEAIDLLEAFSVDDELTRQTEGLLVQAYQMIGDTKKAELTGQIQLYQHLISMIGESVTMMIGTENIGTENNSAENRRFCEETIHRVNQLIEIYNVEQLNQNAVLQFYYITAVCESTYGNENTAAAYLEKFIQGTRALLKKEKLLEEDDYFTRLNEWYDSFTLGEEVPRSRKLIWESAVQSLSHPAFEKLKENKEFKRLLKKAREEKEYEYQ